MEKLQPNCTYHIFNHANGFENIFEEDENYQFFLEKYSLYIKPIAETYAYCLLPNHFHLVVRIRRKELIESIYRKINFSKVSNFGKVSDAEAERFISKQFANLFSSYTQAFNKVNKRRGSLFLKNFRREPIDNREYFKSAVVYTHRNPVHHCFCSRYQDWNYTSFCEIKENKSQLIETSKLLKIFDGYDNFITNHEMALKKYRQQLIADI